MPFNRKYSIPTFDLENIDVNISNGNLAENVSENTAPAIAELNLHTFAVTNPTATFFVRMSSDALEKFGIYTNDIMVVDRSRNPKSGSLVIAVVENSFYARKYFTQKISRSAKILDGEGNEMYLQSETGDFIWGVITHTLHSFI